MRTVKLVYHINPFFATPFSDYPSIFPKFNRILIFRNKKERRRTLKRLISAIETVSIKF